MQRINLLSWTLLAVLLVPALARPAAGQIFPDVTDAERELSAVPDRPDAPAAVLLKRAELRLADDGPSTLDVFVRTKVLTEAGKALAQVAVGHGAGVRLLQFDGRTVLFDGNEERIVPLKRDAVFVERLSAADQRFVTKAALPAVEVGAILDYRFQLQWTGVHVQPLTLEESVPAFLVEVTYEAPRNMDVKHHVLGPADVYQVRDQTAKGFVVRLTATHLPPIYEEPYSFPLNDLVTRVFVVPRSVLRDGPNGREKVALLASWDDAAARYAKLYDEVRAVDRDVKGAANLAASGLPEEEDPKAPDEKFEKRFETSASKVPKNARLRLENVFYWVRDEIANEGSGIGVGERVLDDVLAEKEGNPAEKALLLQAMLAVFEIPSDLVWAIDWRDGFLDLSVVNPACFSRVVVRAELGGEPIFLDPSDRRLPLGRLSPLHEGTKALLLKANGSEIITEIVDLPVSSSDDSVRQARVAFQLDADGRLSGRGSLSLTGHHAWVYLGRSPSRQQEAWTEWLGESFEGFKASHVTVKENVDRQIVDVTFEIVQDEAGVLGDESSLRASRPLGPKKQRYALAPEERRQAVQVSYADRDEVEMVLTWPEGWSVDLVPDDLELVNTAGTVRGTTEVDEEGRRLVYRRTFEITGTRYEPGDEYTALRDLYAALEAHDAQSVVLVKE